MQAAGQGQGQGQGAQGASEVDQAQLWERAMMPPPMMPPRHRPRILHYLHYAYFLELPGAFSGPGCHKIFCLDGFA